MTTADAVLSDELAHAIRGTAADIGALLRPVSDTGRPVPGLTWTLGETAAHLAQANRLMAGLAAGREHTHGDGTPGSIAEANERVLALFPERRAEPLAGMIEEQADAFVTALARRSTDERAVTPMGEMDLPTLGAYLLTHMLGHGYDIARAVRRPHMIDRSRVELTLPFLLAAMPRVLNADAVAGLTARYAVRLRGGPRFGVTIDRGRLTAELRQPERADCTLSMEPVTFLLIALGRANPFAALARGRVLHWGRRPWLAPRFPSFFTAP
ncbi:maleylpyruvate isomerase family mycothiol-dependent enzyme [Streptomyces sp. 6N223]|uniref:maleylpyruvate isomerase family mycothiol-dependent enzyme n=1 Tax=Streptomyces sp. 6N223 TaxID=3457412 RepID=UPI003FD044FB